MNSKELRDVLNYLYTNRLTEIGNRLIGRENFATRTKQKTRALEQLKVFVGIYSLYALTLFEGYDTSKLI